MVSISISSAFSLKNIYLGLLNRIKNVLCSQMQLKQLQDSPDLFIL
jgi:hypothetical protein